LRPWKGSLEQVLEQKGELHADLVAVIKAVDNGIRTADTGTGSESREQIQRLNISGVEHR
jgi:hypothetical protein